MLIAADEVVTTTTSDPELLIGRPLLIAADKVEKTTANDPVLLIEEARQRQRRRQRRQTAALNAAGILVVLGIGTAWFVRSNGSAPIHESSMALPAARQPPSVIYERVETVIQTPHVPTIQRTAEIWFSAAAPETYRELLTIPGEPPFEVGAETRREPKFGREQLVYLYNAQANTIYRTGANLLPPQLSLRSLAQEFFSQPGVVVWGTRVFEGHKVYVARRYGSTSIGDTSETMYIDTTTYQPLLTVMTSPDLRFTIRLLAYRTLPTTAKNLKPMSLARSHPGTRMLPAPPRIDALYGKANQIGTFGGSDLGPVADEARDLFQGIGQIS